MTDREMIDQYGSSLNSGAKSPAFLVTAVILGSGIAALMSKAEPASGALFFVPFALGPLAVSLLLAAMLPRRPSQVALIIGSVAYAAWFGFVFLDVFHWHADPQSAIALVFIGAYSLPVMIPIWIVSLALGRRNRTRAPRANCRL